MFKMTSESKAFLEKHYPALLEETNKRALLIKLDDFITEFGLDSNDDMTLFGHEATAVYDDIFYNN